MHIARTASLGLAVWILTLVAAAANAFAASAAAIDADVNDTLARFTRQVPGGGDIISRAAGVLVFPSVVKAGIGIGGEYGEGALRIAGRTESYYNTISASVGFQFGAQARSVIIVFMTADTLQHFRNSNGWKVGVDGSVAIVTIGVGGAIDTNQLKKPVLGFILDNKGLMYNLTLEGSKITRINK